jgi:hypothetical protein
MEVPGRPDRHPPRSGRGSARDYDGSRRVRSRGAAAVRYGALVVVLLGANYALLAALTGAGLGLLPAKLVTEVVLVAVSYRTQRHLVFTRSGHTRAQPVRPATVRGAS